MIAKRIFDLFFSTIGLFLLLPLFFIVAIWIKLDSPGPVFFRQTRVGRFGRPFQVYKFRTMFSDAESKGRQITVGEDPRITKAGRFLRRYKIDELPQLINVIKGEMSLVGPRPEVPRYVAFYTPEQRRILTVRPGITSAASLAYRHEEEILSGKDWEETYRNKVLPDKIKIDLNYLERRTLLSDIELILRTLASLFD